MKKFITIAATAAVALASTPAFAESSDVATVNMTGNVEQVCTAVPLNGFAGSNFNGGSGTYSRTDDTANVTFNFGIANTNDPTLSSVGQTGQAFFSVAFDTFCNDDFTVTAQATNGAFKNVASAPAGFVNTLPYGYTLKQLNAGGGHIDVGTASTSPAILNSVAYNGNTQIDFNVPPSTTAPVAGDYAETMTVTFKADT